MSCRKWASASRHAAASALFRKGLREGPRVVRDPKHEPYFIIGQHCGRPEDTARAIGKTADLAFGYMGGPKAWARLAPEDETSSEEDRHVFVPSGISYRSAPVRPDKR